MTDSKDMPEVIYAEWRNSANRELTLFIDERDPLLNIRAKYLLADTSISKEEHVKQMNDCFMLIDNANVKWSDAQDNYNDKLDELEAKHKAQLVELENKIDKKLFSMIGGYESTSDKVSAHDLMDYLRETFKEVV